MHVLPPREGEVATSWYRFMERHGPRVHNLAFYVDDYETLVRRLEDAGVRTTMAGTDATPRDQTRTGSRAPTPRARRS